MTGFPFGRAVLLLVLATVGLLWPGGAAAQILTLNLSTTSIAFPAAGDPDTTPTLAAPALTITYGITDRNRKDTWTLTMLASGDLVAGGAVIPISNLTWTATPAPPFRSGTMSATVAQMLATDTTDVTPPRTGTVVFSLVNSWSFYAGTYSQTIVFTLTSQ